MTVSGTKVVRLGSIVKVRRKIIVGFSIGFDNNLLIYIYIFGYFLFMGEYVKLWHVLAERNYLIIGLTRKYENYAFRREKIL